MAYSNFTIEKFCSKFGFDFKTCELFGNFESLEPGSLLQQLLEESQKMPLSSKKARSELIIAPILFDIYLKNDKKIGLYSGVNLDADSPNELNGECDFILSSQNTGFGIKSPIFGLVEAKGESIDKY